jgi:hypothetical protein
LRLCAEAAAGTLAAAAQAAMIANDLNDLNDLSASRYAMHFSNAPIVPL